MAVRVATLAETLRYGQVGLRSRGLLPPIAGGAGYALVGSLGALSAFTTGGITPAFGTGENRVAGNLLICWAGYSSTTPAASITAGWNLAKQQLGNASAASEIYWKIATGADGAPTVTSTKGHACMLAEFSGGATGTPTDQVGGAGSATSPVVGANAAADVIAGELFIYAFLAEYSAGATKTTTPTLNNGMADTSNSNDATSTGNHVRFGFGITTGKSAADQCSMAFTTTNITGTAIAVTSFKLAALLAGQVRPRRPAFAGRSPARGRF